MNNRYIIGTGYVNTFNGVDLFRRELMEYWLRNNLKTSSPELIFVLSMRGSRFNHEDVNEINIPGNTGQLNELISSRKHDFSGASASCLTLAMVAYCNECDFIYKEQDVLCFGNWVEKLYECAGDGAGCMGPNDPCPSGTGLMLFRHAFIPKIVARYLSSRPEHDQNSLMEHHFHEMHDLLRIYSMGFDKKRPVDFDAETFFIHQPSFGDIEILKQKGLL